MKIEIPSIFNINFYFTTNHEKNKRWSLAAPIEALEEVKLPCPFKGLCIAKLKIYIVLP